MAADEPKPIDPETIAAWAAMADIVIPEPCLPGVAANIALLREHAERLAESGPE